LILDHNQKNPEKASGSEKSPEKILFFKEEERNSFLEKIKALLQGNNNDEKNSYMGADLNAGLAALEESKRKSTLLDIMESKKGLKLSDQKFYVKMPGLLGFKKDKILTMNEDFEFVFFLVGKKGECTFQKSIPIQRIHSIDQHRREPLLATLNFQPYMVNFSHYTC